MSEAPIIRPATRADIPGMCRVLVRSITELCAADHKNDPKHLASWTENKTPEGLSTWFDNPQFEMRLSLAGEKIAAVGGFSISGRIEILYVDPDARGGGHSTSLLRAMERELAQRGVTVAELTSTNTALAFYKKHGWRVVGDPVSCHTVSGHPLQKNLGH